MKYTNIHKYNNITFKKVSTYKVPFQFQGKKYYQSPIENNNNNNNNNNNKELKWESGTWVSESKKSIYKNIDNERHNEENKKEKELLGEIETEWGRGTSTGFDLTGAWTNLTGLLRNTEGESSTNIIDEILEKAKPPPSKERENGWGTMKEAREQSKEEIKPSKGAINAWGTVKWNESSSMSNKEKIENNLSEKGLKKELNQEELKKENLEENEGKVKKVAKNVKKKIIETSKKIFKSPPI